MRKLTLLALSALVFALILAAPQASAEERNLGKHSQNEIRDACNKAGGQLLRSFVAQPFLAVLPQTITQPRRKLVPHKSLFLTCL